MSLLNGKWVENIFIQEAPSGTINSSNVNFTLTYSPIFTSAIIVFVNGVALTQTAHYSVSGNAITFTAAPATGSSILAVYIRSL